jgi:aerobic C4-dicarboxylate transport protein
MPSIEPIPIAEQERPTKHTGKHHRLYLWVLGAAILGVVFGLSFPVQAVAMQPLATGFIKLIRMLIAPIIFAAVVTGIAGMDNLKSAGRIGLKALVYFEVMTTVALILGWSIAAIFHPGAGMNVDPGALNTSDLQSTLATASATHTMPDFLLNLIPKTMVGAFADGDMIQVLLVSVLFAIALAQIGQAGRPLVRLLEQVSAVLMGIMSWIIKLAPLAVFGALSYTIGKFGLASLKPILNLLACIYLTSLFFVLVGLGLVLRFFGVSIWKFLRYIRDEVLIVYGTGSSESVFPRMIEKMETLGCSKSVVGLVLPAGYSFNLDGTAIYLTMGALFIAQATNTPLTFGQQFSLLVVCLVTSKGAAGVAGSGFLVLAATLSSMKMIPVEGLALILGVDFFLTQARAMTNLVGNGVATVAMACWEKEFDAARAARVLAGDYSE